jgi:hypothetical protein
MKERPDFMVRRALARALRTARRVGAAITLSLGLGAGFVAHAGVPPPVIAETTGMLTLATVVKRIAPSVVTIEGRGRVAAEPGTKRRQAGKGIALAAQDEFHTWLRRGVRRAPRSPAQGSRLQKGVHSPHYLSEDIDIAAMRAAVSSSMLCSRFHASGDIKLDGQ